MRFAVTCPGQGFVRANLLAPYLQYKPNFLRCLEEIDESLNEKFSHKLFNHDAAWLMKTSNAQPAIVSTTYIIHQILKNHFGIDVVSPQTVLLGHSLGEYTALLLNQQLSFPTALKLVRLRAQLMEQLDLSTKGYGMKVIIFRPANFTRILEICQENQVVANINSYQQLVLSGKHTTIQQTIDQLNNPKKSVLKTIDLPVQVPFHHQALEPIQAELKTFLESQATQTGITSVISNISGNETSSSSDIINNTINSNSRPVQWVESMATLSNIGVKHIINLGPGDVLHNINTKYDFTNHSVDTLNPESIDSIRHIIK